MADSDHRWSRDLPEQGAKKASRAQADDPLAELARLIGQTLPMSHDVRPATPTTTSAANREFDEPVRGGYAAPENVADELPDDRYSHSASRQAGEYPSDLDSRYDRSDGYPVSQHATAEQFEDEWHSRPAEEQPRSSRAGRYADEYEQAPHDHVDDPDGDHGYSEEEEYPEDPNARRRGGFIFVAAVFALALLGTAGAFAYRTMFGGPMLPSLPPIIKAEGGPTKIVPSGGNAQGAGSRQADASGGNGASERLVSREEQPLNAPPPVSTAPRVVSTVPVFPDPPSTMGPGSAPAVFPPPNPVPLVQAGGGGTPPPPASRVDAFGALPGAAATTTNPPISGNQVAGSAPGPKKIRTVTIRSDQSPASDTAGSQAAAARPAGQQQPNKPSNDGPLALVPAAGDTGSATTPRPRAATPARPVPLNKPDATETASVAPVAPGGGYAVQVSSQQSEEEAQTSFRALQAKYPTLLGGRQPIVRRADLGAKGIYYRTMVGPFASADEASDLCTKLKAAGGSCLVQKN
jgi:SPOR domain